MASEPCFAFKCGSCAWWCTWGGPDIDHEDLDAEMVSAYSRVRQAPSTRDARACASQDYSRATNGSHIKWDWETFGEPWFLLKDVGKTVARQVACCMLIVLQVFRITAPDAGYLLPCNPYHIGWTGAVFCEWTKAHVRYFPLLAILAAVMTANRAILCRRLYYQLLKRRILLDFENFNAMRDPLCWILIWCMSMAFSHFVYETYTREITGEEHEFGKGKISDEMQKLTNETVLHNAVHHTKDIAVFYIAPAVAFFTFYVNSLDIEADLVPLSKYVEEFYSRHEVDEDERRNALADLHYLSEERAEMIARRDDLIFHDNTAETVTSDEAFLAVMELSRDEVFAQKKVKRTKCVPHFKVLKACWPSKLLLDTRIMDDDARRFRNAWFLYIVISVILKVVVALFFVQEVFSDLFDVVEGQLTDLVALFVAAAHIVLILHLLRKDKDIFLRAPKKVEIAVDALRRKMSGKRHENSQAAE